MRMGFRAFTGVALCAAVAFGAAACGGGGRTPDVANGRDLFRNGANGRQACSYCHTMRAADSAGTFAPNLDSDTQEDRSRLHMSEQEIGDLVLKNINDGQCLDPTDPSRCMPAGLLSGNDATDVAAFVARCANRPRAAQCPQPAPVNALAAEGARLYGSLKCMGCHSTNGNVAVAPTFRGLFGSQIELTNGETVTANESYLIHSILSPDAEIVAGYKPGFMTGIVPPGSVSVAQVRALIAYIRSLPKPTTNGS